MTEAQDQLQTVFDLLYAEHGSMRRVLVPYVRAMLTPEQERAVELCTNGDDRLTAMLEFCTAYMVANNKQPQTMSLPHLPAFR